MFAILLALALPQDGCPAFPEDLSEERHPKPLQASGKGLWIGGLGFGAEDIIDARPATDPDTRQWTLNIRLTAQGVAKFQQAQRCGIGQPIEISVDGAVLSRPRLMERILSGEMSLSGGWQTRDEVAEMAGRVLPR